MTNENVTVYGLAQCWEFVNGTACEDCLANAVLKIRSCTPKEEGQALNAGCYLKYSTKKFYSNSTQSVINSNQGEFGSNEFFSFFLFCLSSIESNGTLVFSIVEALNYRPF